jgi:hypothetical protein
MRLTQSKPSIRLQLSIKGLAIVAILILALVGGLFHHHKPASHSVACSYCHAGVQTPVIDLAVALVVPLFAVVGIATPARPSHVPRIDRASTLIPRAPPGAAFPDMFQVGGVGLA